MQNPSGLLLVFALWIVSYSVAPQHVVAQCNCGTACKCPDCPIASKKQQGRWLVVESANFQICCDEDELEYPAM